MFGLTLNNAQLHNFVLEECQKLLLFSDKTGHPARPPNYGSIGTMNFLNTATARPEFSLSPIKAIELAAAETPGAISLAQGIPSFGTPQVIRDFVKERISEGLCDKYSLTNGVAELRDEIAQSLATDGLRYDPDREIVVTAGSIEGITASLLSMTSPGDEVLLPSPSYASYLGAISIAGCTPKYFELDEDNNFDFDLDRVRREITKRTSVLLFCSPNNPTGTIFSPTKTCELVELCRQHKISILVDEVYKDFYYTDAPHFTATSISAARDQIVRVCSFSKAYAMTGWRVGFVHGSEHRIKRILKYHDAMVTCAPVVSQYAAIAALRYGGEFLDHFRSEFKLRRDRAIALLDQLSFVLDYQLPQATYFVFPRIKDSVALSGDSTRLAYDILAKAKVAVVPGVAFGPSGESHLRINFGRDWPDLEEGLSRLGQYFTGERVTRPSARIPSTDSTLTTPQVSLGHLIRAKLLGGAARLYLLRDRPTIIGIAGSRGKTAVKRLLHEKLRTNLKVRSSILSYNTEIGLPLSILDLDRPKDFKEWLLFPCRLLWRLIGPRPPLELLVLEYGVRRVEDAKWLKWIATPDWLVLTGVITHDPNLDHRMLADGLIELAKSLPPERVILRGEDPHLSSTECLPNSPRIANESSTGDSVKFGDAVASLFLEKLGLNKPF